MLRLRQTKERLHMPYASVVALLVVLLVVNGSIYIARFFVRLMRRGREWRLVAWFGIFCSIWLLMLALLTAVWEIDHLWIR